ncbi:MAG: ABC transporter ATP-binding protein [Chitinophagaceae bacterium]|nr:ABC transporter ATP-binding protein [Chitinophagaceae bacterium]
MEILLKSISKNYNSKEVLKNINLKFGEGINCILGINGAGKSTLLNIILNLIEPTEGEVFIDGLRYSIEEESVKIKLISGGFTDINKLIPELTIEEYLYFLADLYKLKREVSTKRIKSLVMYFFDDYGISQKSIGSLSTGMQKKVEIISSLAHNPSLIVLDEPFSGLDPISAKALINLLNSLKNKIIILTSHDINYVDECAEYIHVLNNKNLEYSGLLKDFKGEKLTLLEKFIEHSKQTNKSLEEINWLN